MDSLQARIDLLERIVPFRFLNRAEKRKLAGDLHEQRFPANEQIIEQGANEKRIYLLQSGSVGIYDPSSESPHLLLNTIVSGHYFGERSVLFDRPRALQVRALEPARCWTIEGQRMLQLLKHSRTFAQSLGSILRGRQGIFDAFDRFKAELVRSVNQGYINVPRLLTLYKTLQPILHRHITDKDHIDLAALGYAVRRLPENISSTFVFLLVDELPLTYSDLKQTLRSIASPARRRDVWELMPGKDLVLLRNGLTDLTDLVTCICLYAVEAEKIRHRLHGSPVLKRLSLHTGKSGELLADMPFSAEERTGLTSIWPKDTIDRLRDIAFHREMFAISVHRQRNNYNNRKSDVWTAQISSAVRDLIGARPADMAADLPVHIISSNAHSVTHCLNPWFTENSQRILEWGRTTQHPYLQHQWDHELDCVYAMANDYFADNPDQNRRMYEAEQRYGIMQMEMTASTGIQAQLIDTGRIAGQAIDPGIEAVQKGGHRSVIVNIDYAFGEQAEHIMRNLLMLFCGNLASINFLGKAGGLQGGRGDILSPTAFIQQISDVFTEVPKQSHTSAAKLSAALKNKQLHIGPMLTVDGTLLQNRIMLNFYRHIWNCIGIEMEGSHYYRPVSEAKQLAMIGDDVKLRFLYYVSDLPLETTANLSTRMAPNEGIPPLYAITRRILSGLLHD